MAIDHFRNEVGSHSNDGDQAHPLESPRIEVTQANSTVIHFDVSVWKRKRNFKKD